MTTAASLKKRLLLPVLGIIALVWTSAVVLTYRDARNELDEVLDAHLAQAASLLDAQTLHRHGAVDTDHAPQLHKYSRQVAFQIWETNGKLGLHSINAPDEPLAAFAPGFSNRMIDAHRWRVFTTWDSDQDHLIQIAERADRREHLAREIAGHLLLPLLITLPVLAVLLWLAITKALRPLVGLADEVERRAPGNLTPLDPGRAPAEIAPLIQRLNVLFERIRDSLDSERCFTADAAHELRTPVAAIRAQAQVARGAAEDAERIHALDKAIAGCDRATHLIEQLLTLARLDATREQTKEPCALRTIAGEVIAEMAPTALGNHIQLELADGPDLTVPGQPGLLRVLLRNLLNNAIHHTGPGTVVTVQPDTLGGKPVLRVFDNGPGVNPETLAHLSERFYRPLGTRGDGSGLGLSIARRIAELHQAEFRLSSPPDSGLHIDIVFP
jgi:two-component system sensor histidine kinase QseC